MGNGTKTRQEIINDILDKNSLQKNQPTQLKGERPVSPKDRMRLMDDAEYMDYLKNKKD